jgi:phospholipid transport system substrate-binding protein
MKKKLFRVFFTLILLVNNATALEPDIFVQSTVNRASKLLSEDISKEDKIEKLKTIARDTVDI